MSTTRLVPGEAVERGFLDFFSTSENRFLVTKPRGLGLLAMVEGYATNPRPSRANTKCQS